MYHKTKYYAYEKKNVNFNCIVININKLFLIKYLFEFYNFEISFIIRISILYTSCIITRNQIFKFNFLKKKISNEKILFYIFFHKILFFHKKS